MYSYTFFHGSSEIKRFERKKNPPLRIRFGFNLWHNFQAYGIVFKYYGIVYGCYSIIASLLDVLQSVMAILLLDLGIMKIKNCFWAFWHCFHAFRASKSQHFFGNLLKMWSHFTP